MKEAIQKAIEGGYQYTSDSNLFTDAGKLLDPLFWHCLFGQKYGKIKALEFYTHILDGKETEQWFVEQMANMGKEQQEKESPQMSDMWEGSKKTS